MSTNRSMLVLGVVAGVLGLPSVVDACACCDGGEERTVVAWSASGRSALVEMRTTGCRASAAYEVWEVGRDAPVRCFDRYADVERAIACDALVDAWDVHDDGPEGVPLATSRRLATRFPQAARSLAATFLHATLTPVADPDDPTSSRRVRLDVYVSTASHASTVTGSTSPPSAVSPSAASPSAVSPSAVSPSATSTAPLRLLSSRELRLGRPEDYSLPEEEQRTSIPIAIRVWPSPNGHDVLVEVSGENADPEMGFFPDHVSFARLDAIAALGTVERTEPVLASPRYQPSSPSPDARRDAARFVRRGLALHATGDFVASAGLFVSALTADPSSAGARYDLACALARQGRDAAALALLGELRLPDCRRCRALLRRAPSDPDLESLRGRM
ncbi:MAG: hypothetical protein ACK6CU_30010 [Deltaproteobacteria bacterium]|jgi:hypothetical protein